MAWAKANCGKTKFEVRVGLPLYTGCSVLLTSQWDRRHQASLLDYTANSCRQYYCGFSSEPPRPHTSEGLDLTSEQEDTHHVSSSWTLPAAMHNYVFLWHRRYVSMARMRPQHDQCPWHSWHCRGQHRGGNPCFAKFGSWIADLFLSQVLHITLIGLLLLP